MKELWSPFYYLLIVDNVEFYRTRHTAHSPRKGSTIKPSGFKFKVVAEEQDLDLYDNNQVIKVEKAAEGIIAIPRNLEANKDTEKIKEALRRAVNNNGKPIWKESPISEENKIFIDALKNKRCASRPGIMDLVMLVITILFFAFSIIWTLYTQQWVMISATMFAIVVFSGAFSKNSVFRKG